MTIRNTSVLFVESPKSKFFAKLANFCLQTSLRKMPRIFFFVSGCCCNRLIRFPTLKQNLLIFLTWKAATRSRGPSSSVRGCQQKEQKRILWQKFFPRWILVQLSAAETKKKQKPGRKFLIENFQIHFCFSFSPKMLIWLFVALKRKNSHQHRSQKLIVLDDQLDEDEQRIRYSHLYTSDCQISQMYHLGQRPLHH